MCTLSIPILGPHDAHHNSTLECEFSQTLCGLDKKYTMHGTSVVATSAVGIPPNLISKLALDVPGLPFLSWHGTCNFKLSANALPWFSY